jgi:SPP1 family predicted phage head-tail adaptor
VINIGKLDRRITINSVTRAPTGTGDATETDVLVVECWAAFRAPRGAELIEAGQVVGQVDGVFKIRWLAGLAPGMRVAYDGQTWDIFHVVPLGRDEALELYTRVLRREGDNG